jgi:outer membrane protein, heavy metal efflux system
MIINAQAGARARPRPVSPFGGRQILLGRLRSPVFGCAITVIALLVPGCGKVWGEPAPPYPLLLQQAELNAPRLREIEANTRAAEGRRDQAGLLPNPSVNLYSENLGSGTVAGFSAQQNTLSVNEPIEFGGKRTARIASGNADLNSTAAEGQLQKLTFVYDLAVDYAAAEAAQARIDLYQTAADSAAEDLRAAQALVNAGREAELRAVQANSALESARSDLEGARAELQAALATLSALVASPQLYSGVPPYLLPLAATLDKPVLAPPREFPAVAAAEAERQSAARRVEVERTRPAPTVTATLGVRQIAGFNSPLVVAGVIVPLPLFDDNSGNIAAALAELDGADARLAAARAAAEAGWTSAVTQANAAGLRLSAARQAVSAADSAYRLSRTGYDAGRTPLIEVLTARRNLTDAQLRELDAQVTRIRAEADLSRISGRIPFGAPL